MRCPKCSDNGPHLKATQGKRVYCRSCRIPFSYDPQFDNCAWQSWDLKIEEGMRIRRDNELVCLVDMLIKGSCIAYGYPHGEGILLACADILAARRYNKAKKKYYYPETTDGPVTCMECLVHG